MIRAFDIGDYHLRFSTKTGFMARWGKTPDDDPPMCPVGPEIADIEISTICHGIGKDMESRKPCSWCYKSNTGCGENMSLETFKRVFSLFPKTLTQIAFGIGDIDGNPDLWNIMKHCRENGVIPNITTNGMGVHDTCASLLAHYCGAVAVSHYGDDDLCFGTIQHLTNNGLQQVNLHKLLASETLQSCHALIDKVATDPRCSKLKAIVFLLLKPKGARNALHPVINIEDYRKLYEHALERGVSIGFDSCSAPVAMKTIPLDNPLTLMSMEPCESTLFSIYVNVKGELCPCSFTEGAPGWEKGIDLLDSGIKDFTQDVWKSYRLQNWREKLLVSSSGCKSCSMQKHCRSCPVYPEITVCKEKP
jgi:radical SAM protein with 4Fe4S-binding SPASM domain